MIVSSSQTRTLRLGDDPGIPSLTQLEEKESFSLQERPGLRLRSIENLKPHTQEFEEGGLEKGAGARE